MKGTSAAGVKAEDDPRVCEARKAVAACAVHMKAAKRGRADADGSALSLSFSETLSLREELAANRSSCSSNSLTAGGSYWYATLAGTSFWPTPPATRAHVVEEVPVPAVLGLRRALRARRMTPVGEKVRPGVASGASTLVMVTSSASEPACRCRTPLQTPSFALTSS